MKDKIIAGKAVGKRGVLNNYENFDNILPPQGSSPAKQGKE